MARVTTKDLESLTGILQGVDTLIERSEEVLEESMIEPHHYPEFQRNPEGTMKWILEVQEALTLVANAHTQVLIMDRRLWAFSEKIKQEYGVMGAEEFIKRINAYLKTLRDLSGIFRERKADLTQDITSVRSVQSAVTERMKTSLKGC